ncbi:hypothetical protein FE257_011397 [Aspergillus nanangensis]|uniref:Uncharacterized protein n=1 Tax=Aspergillus nanangensis TaxID=2582783 RepID=A0AAD4CHB7_ASPNN|nr:hypothetical protein FE257_011397 [Aspergillus nanangensis]
MSTHDSVGENGALLYGELAAVVTIMYQRASQPILPEDEEEEAGMFEELDNAGEESDGFPRAFPTEQRFPVLMASLFGPQHGRLIYAMVEGGRLVIHQSRIYSFEKEATAPFDLFARWLLSAPAEGPACN